MRQQRQAKPEALTQEELAEEQGATTQSFASQDVTITQLSQDPSSGT